MKTSIPSVLITFLLLCFGLSPTGKALLPAPSPDGGYPGGNTAEGINALHDVNIAVGINNTAVGANALTRNTTGYYNVAVGSGALGSNTTGNFNMAIGSDALNNNNSNFNLAIGFRVGFMNTTGSHLTGIGAAALRNNTTASDNTAIGADALRENTTGENNTAIGADALAQNTIGEKNTAIGSGALGANTWSSANTAIGYSALSGRNYEGANTAIGYYALSGNIGLANTAVGANALRFNEGGDNNTAIGDGAGYNQTTGSHNVYIGFGMLGTAGENDACYIRSIFGQTSVDGIPVLINSNNKLGTTTSSKRFKEDIKPMDKASDALFALKPVTFRYKKEIDPAGRSQLGLVAEEVEKVNPDLVVRDKEGKPYSVHYDQVNAMLLNEFLKEHRKNEHQEKTIAEVKSAMIALAATVKEQAAQIQKVSAQVEASKPAPQVVNNNQ